MASYLLIESRDPFESADVAFCHDLARRLAVAGNRVTVFVVQNGVLGVRAGARSSGYAELARAGVEVLAETSRCASAALLPINCSPGSRRHRSISSSTASPRAQRRSGIRRTRWPRRRRSPLR